MEATIEQRVNALAALIRKVYGRHDLSAAALAERLVEEGVTVARPAPEEARRQVRDAFQALRDALPDGAAEARLGVYLEEQREAAAEATLLAESQRLAEAARNVLHRAEECGFTREQAMTDFSLSLSQLRAALSAAEAPAGRDG